MIKWGAKMEERVSFDNTYIRSRLDSITDQNEANQLINDITQMGIYQIKFSSWTRKSHIIETLMSKYPNKSSNSGEKSRKRKYRKYTKKYKHRKYKKHTKKYKKYKKK